MQRSKYSRADFGSSPFVVFYEVTRACDLVCRHCRACAQTQAHPNELSTTGALGVLDEFARFPKPPLVVLTGGDPLKRPDVFGLIEAGRGMGLSMAMTPSATPLVTEGALRRLRDAGLARLAVSLDGLDAQTHDAFRGVAGSFDLTLRIMRDANRLGLPLQINTTVTARNFDQIDAMAEMLGRFDLALWSVFFLIPVGRGLKEQRISPEQYERAFEKLWQHAQHQPYGIKTTEAPHYRRFVIERRGDPLAPVPGRAQRAPIGVNDGKGVMFVSHTGQVFPSGFLPIECGRFPRDSIIDVYQHHPVFQSLRDPDQLGGKCGRCEYRAICGGSRARAYALTRDHLAEEPDCTYQPRIEPQEPERCSA